ncbi:Putative histone acetyltransferase subunit 3 [Septoria linicola]|uniref:Histone acetyltransferase subunit 3 n=1 Tax=Septoria linicola TaxID=215465 RepID=A0A9Q9ARG9_9PEZI|nr:Putative histone acetyltransferase subunit 3 [Septoria linicola]
MPASKKGTQGKATSATNRNAHRRSSSRQTTPLTEASTTPATATPSAKDAPSATMTPYLKTSTAALISSDPSIEALIDRSNASVARPGDPPTVRELRMLHDTIRDTVNRFMSKRGEVCDRSMRQLVQRRKERLQEEREQEAARDAERARVKREEERAAKKEKNSSKKRSADEMDVDGDEKERKEALPSVGAHGLARQDGVGVHQGADAPPSPKIEPGTVPPDLMETAPDDSDSETSRHDPPPTAPLYERIYGKDPTAVEDPVRYHIPEVADDMTEDEKRAIFSVYQWPESDLRELTAGDPPDADFYNNAKPATQVNFSTFQTYVEPYIRAFTEEDVAFLKERGDRVTPYIMPQRGAKGYKEIWAAEDGLTGLEPPKQERNNPNEARGSMDTLEDDIADQDTVSMGPVMSRLLSVIRPQPTTKKEETEDAGDTSMANADDEIMALINGTNEDQKPVTYLPPDFPKPANLPQIDYETFEDRALQELRYIGFIGHNEAPDFDSHNDDEVAARLRTLQHKLREISYNNNIRKARVLELTEERMAMQEYANIADDLDNQVNAAYLKRNRSLAKPNQKKGASQRPGQKGVASAPAGRGVSDGVRALMQKRKDWIDMVGPVVAYGRPPIPGDDETIFKTDDQDWKRLEKLEKEAEMGEADGE